MKRALDQLSDEEVLRRMLAGDSSSFAELYRRWQSGVYRFALRMGGSAPLAEDITQEVFLTLMRDGAQYAGRGKFAAYILTIARHAMLRRLQRERRFVALEKDESEEDFDGSNLIDRSSVGPDPLAELVREETIEAVRQAVIGLPLHYREVVLLCHLHDLSYAEAAEVIGCEIGTVCSRLYRARAMLARRLESLRSESEPKANMRIAR